MSRGELKEISAAVIRNLNEKLARRELDLARLNKEKEAEVKELIRVRAQLEEAKGVLEFKVIAKTKELRELTENLERQVRSRTSELRDKIAESENSRVALLNMLEDMEDLRRHAEDEREKTLAIIANFADGLLFFGADDRLALVNPQAETIFGLAKEDAARAIGKKISDLPAIGGLKPVAEALGLTLKKRVTRKEIYLNENLVLEISSLEIASRSKIGTLIIAHDISREKIVERMKTEFVSIAAHQLRTPISAIKWTVRMILDGDLGPINGEQRDFLEKTYQSNERMITLINDLLNVTRIEEGRHLYNLILVNIEDIIRTLLANYTEIAKRKGLQIEFCEPKAKLPRVRVDVEKIRLVISNLVENAIKYTPANGKISLAAEQTGDGVQVLAKDTGVGILKEQQARIFTKYFRGSNVMRLETEGTGLGLFIAKNIVETHGGKIWFASEENKGTTFYFTLPLPKSPA